MAYPTITLKQCDYAQITQNKTGDLAMVYKPLQNLVKDTTLGNFTTEKLNFNRYDAQDMLIVDEFDGSTNIIINDDNNQPRLINSGFSVQEDNTFLIPEHYTNTVTNIYDDTTFGEDTQLLKLYNKIPKLTFKGLGEGSFKCGSYVFYFRLSDSVGNMSNVVQHSSTVQVFIGENGTYQVRMGMEDENANKSVKFELTDIDSGFDYIRVFYERTSSGADQANTTLFYMIDQNFPIVNGKCELTLTGEEQTLGISLSDIKNEYADIAACKTQAIVDNTLFLANTESYVHDYAALQRIAWCIYPTFEPEIIELPNTAADGKAKGYYDPLNVYNKAGYWPDEYYRFGIVFVYNNNQLSPVFNIQGYDAQSTLLDTNSLEQTLLGYKLEGENTVYELPEFEPDNYIFNKDVMSNSKGVVKTPVCNNISETFKVCFNLNDSLKTYIQYTNDLRSDEKQNYIDNKDYNIKKFLNEKHGIKGFFFVRQKRIPTVIAQGLVVGLTTKDFGSIPVLADGDTLWKTKSFLSKGRMVLPSGGTIYTYNDKDYTRVGTQALLVPDAELQEATYNQLFTSQEFVLQKQAQCKFKIQEDDCWWEYRSLEGANNIYKPEIVKLTAVPKDTTIKTNGVDYFSTLAGTAEEAFKTEDIFNKWNKTFPQDLTKSQTLIRGRWGYYVGMSANSFNFGDIVSIKKAGFIKNPEQNLLEFQDRFADNSFYSPISTRYSIDKLSNSLNFEEFGGDCFSSMFTHRMMTNFIDPELPTNDKIVNPSCWCENYAVRCTAEILSDTHSNLTGDSAGFYIPSPSQKIGHIASLIFGILTGNIVTVIQAAQDLANADKNTIKQKQFANEVAQAFEVYTGNPSPSSDNYRVEDDNWFENGGYDQYSSDDSLQRAASEGKIKAIKPKEMEQNASGFNLKAIFKSDDKWELHGIAKINRADVNAVALGQWITFPIRSSMNIALRDVDFSQATEEAKFNRKRSFYPLTKRDIYNKLPDSNVINGAAKKTIHKNSYPVYKTVPFMKQEYFNRIYWSKPNVADAFLNSYRMIYTDQYKEYNKEFGDITKILPLGNSLFVCFDHGMGIVPVDRSVKTETEASPYLASRNVLPAQVTTLSKDFGSMWKNSVIQTPNNLIYGVDTVAKKIWRTNGQNVEFISDHYVTKFLNDFIDLSEFDYRAYQGHLDVKTHYNNFKHDVIFTLVKDIPLYKQPTPKDTGVVENLRDSMQLYWGVDRHTKVSIKSVDAKNDGNGLITFIIENNQEKTADIQNGKIYINDIFTGVWCDIDHWEEGTVWSLCYNEVLQKWTTFYDWYPVESCNVDNIFFTFDQEQVDNVYDLNNPVIYRPDYRTIKQLTGPQISNKYFIDKTFSDKVLIYRSNESFRFTYPWFQEKPEDRKETFISFYYKNKTQSRPDLQSAEYLSLLSKTSGYVCEDGWVFVVAKTTSPLNVVTIIPTEETDFAEIKVFQLSDNQTWEDAADGTLGYRSKQNKEPDHLKYYEVRDYSPNRMYLWKHGQAGLYDNEGKILPTHWYGKQHEFNFEFVVNDNPIKQKIFNTLKILSNKAAPAKFEYEVVGEGYEWFEYKPIVEWINKKTEENASINWWKCVLNRNSKDIVDGDTDWAPCPDFPSLLDETRVIKKLPYLKMKHTDKKGTPERPHYKWDGGTDCWGGRPYDKHNQEYTYNCSEPCLVEDDQLNEVRLRTESLGNDIKKYGRLRGNMQYLEDLWNVEIRPVQITWCYLDNEGEFQTKKITETRHRDKYIKIKVRYSGEDLALIQAIYTIFEESYS